MDISEINMRAIHRYLGFFLAGIMFVYSLSGIVLIYRKTDTFKVEKHIEMKLQPGLEASELGKQLKLRNLKILKSEGDILFFDQGTYNRETGISNHTIKELPFVLGRLTDLHLASTEKPLYWLNIFFGGSLMFFVISSFWMFRPKTKVWRDGLIISIIGVILTLAIVFL